LSPPLTRSTLTRSDARSLLLVTDGQSYSLDVHALVQLGRRIDVLLIGSGSLEAMVGHLAILSGGEIFIAPDNAISAALDSALAATRRISESPGNLPDRYTSARSTRSGVTALASWADDVADNASGTFDRAVAALAASLALPGLSKEKAAGLAEQEGLVTHLTSLVLVDHDGAIQETIPAFRKIAIADAVRPTQGAGAFAPRSAPRSASRPQRHAPECAQMPEPPEWSRPFDLVEPAASSTPAFRYDKKNLQELSGRPGILQIAEEVDWDGDPERLLAADLNGQEGNTKLLLLQLMVREELGRVATEFGVDKVLLILAVLAEAVSSTSRSANRLWRKLREKIPLEAVEEARQQLFGSSLSGADARQSPDPE